MIDRVETVGNCCSTCVLRFATLLLLMIVVLPVMARRRAVRSGPPLPVRFLALPAKAVTITNHDAGAAALNACLATCRNAVLPAGATSTLALEGLGTANLLTLRSTTDLLEARTDTMTMLHTASLRADRQALPVVDLTTREQTLLILSTSDGTVDVALIGFSGVQEDVRTYSVGAGVTTIPNPYGVAASHKQLELRSAIPIAALLAVTKATTTTYLAAQPLAAASPRQFVLGVQDARYWIKNPLSDGWFVANAYLWPSDQDNTGVFLQRNASVINGGIRTDTISTTRQSSFEVTGAYDPARGVPARSLAFAMAQDRALPFIDASSGAIGRSALPTDTTVRKQLSINLPGMLMLLNASEQQGAVRGKLLGYDLAGNQTSVQEFTLRTKESKTYHVTSARTIITVSDAVDSAMIPIVIASLDESYVPLQMDKAIDRVTGEEYVAKWLDPLKEQYFYLPYRQVRCFFRGGCGTPSFATRAAELFATSPSFSRPYTVEELTRILRDDFFDEEYTNSEVYPGFSPLNTSMANSGVGLYQCPDGRNAATVKLPAITAWYALLREFLVLYVSANPHEFGGSAATGPSLATNPQWTTAQRTPAEQYLIRWYDATSPSRLYFSNREVRCAITGTCGAPTIRTIMAANLVHSTTTSMAEEELRSWLTTITDGIAASGNPELWPHHDPLAWDAGSDTWTFTITEDGTTSRDVQFGRFPSGQGPNLARWLRATMHFLADRHPDWYGGTTTPNPDFNPTWSTQDPNTP